MPNKSPDPATVPGAGAERRNDRPVSNLLFLLSRESVKVAALDRIYAAHQGSPSFASDAIFAMRQMDGELAWRAAWLLRRMARDRRLGDDDLVRIAASAEETTHWIARLILCQLFSLTGCPDSGRESLYPFLTECFADKRALVRAWAISALATLANDATYRPEILKMIRKAQKDRAKSVISRMRHLKVPRRPGDPAPALAKGRSGLR
jgi:hypothetical protein